MSRLELAGRSVAGLETCIEVPGLKHSARYSNSDVTRVLQQKLPDSLPDIVRVLPAS